MTGVGLIFHYGLYSFYGFDDVKSAMRRKTGNGAEWYLKRLSVKEGDYRPISGYKETQTYHYSHFGNSDYYTTAEKAFPPPNIVEKMGEWIKLAKEIGATYVIITTKHHDGYCLFNTTTTPHHSKVDIVDHFTRLAREAGLRVGFYYSILEFGHSSCNKDYLNNILAPQINELKKFKPDIWWFDGHWFITTVYGNDLMQKICADLRSTPGVEINDRIYGKKNSPYDDVNHLGLSTFRSYEDRAIPSSKPIVPWEHICTIGLSWGYNRDQKPENYQDLNEKYKVIKSLGGRFLVNLGPMVNGELDPNEVAILRKLKV